MGKFLFVGEEKLYVKGVTYGTFRPRDGCTYPTPAVVAADFRSMVAAGINAVRTYDVPPRWLLDLAAENGLRVLVGLPWEQHVAFLGDGRLKRKIEAGVRAGVRACAGHPAVLAFAIGNEIPASIVRWHGRRPIERFIRRLYRAAKAEDPEALVTYVNFPTTEYLHLDFLDFCCFNVYLESEEPYTAYIARLHNIAGDKPLVMSEIGLDSSRNGTSSQAQHLDWQIRSTFAGGCAGCFVFAWTDEWFRGGCDIDEWDFGLTDRQRKPKPALGAVQEAYAEAPFPANIVWPRVSVVVCSYNGARTLRDCLEGIARLEYPNFETIVVNDGSTDATPAIASEFDVRLINTENRGLSNARNTGMEAADCEIVAYTDDDARPDPHWLQYLAATFLRGDYAAVGGPNIAPPGDGLIADCVANAPGGPVHVLLDDSTAEHIPGCNMAFRKDSLKAIGGFDPRYRTAGDDVDACWRIQEQGGTLAFSPAGMVWHHRRNSVRTYWRQQLGYGRAEALLEGKWPERYNALGHLSWVGRLYGKGLTTAMRPGGASVYQGTWGLAPYQSIYEPAAPLLFSFALMPEWYLLIAFLAGLTAVGAAWLPLLLVVAPLLAIAGGLVLVQALASAGRAGFTSPGLGRFRRVGMYVLTAYFHLVQPLARLRGRLRFGLSPWRRRGSRGLALPLPGTRHVWSGDWRSVGERLSRISAAIRANGGIRVFGGPFHRWDLHVRGGLLGGARLAIGVEEHVGTIQFVRYRTWPVLQAPVVALVAAFGTLAAFAILDGALIAGVIMAALCLALAGTAALDCSRAMAQTKAGVAADMQ